MATSAALRQINQARILSTLRKGSWSRVALAEHLGLNRSTATVIVNALLEQGLVREIDPVPHRQGATGRPRVGIALNGSGAYFGGLELGNQTLTAVVADLTGREIDRASAPTVRTGGPDQAETTLGDLLADVLGRHPGVTLQGLGLTLPGLVTNSGRLDWAPWLNWRDATLGESLRARFGIEVRIENDANAAALAEEQLRPRSEGDNLLYLLLDAGVGGSLLVDRELYRGSAGRVGEVGHIRLPSPAGGASTAVEETLGREAVLAAFAGTQDSPQDHQRPGQISWPPSPTAGQASKISGIAGRTPWGGSPPYSPGPSIPTSSSSAGPCPRSSMATLSPCNALCETTAHRASTRSGDCPVCPPRTPHWAP